MEAGRWSAWVTGTSGREWAEPSHQPGGGMPVDRPSSARASSHAEASLQLRDARAALRPVPRREAGPQGSGVEGERLVLAGEGSHSFCGGEQS